MNRNSFCYCFRLGCRCCLIYAPFAINRFQAHIQHPMQIKVCKTTEWSDHEWKTFVDSFISVFKRDIITDAGLCKAFKKAAGFLSAVVFNVITV